ncbi:MAG TPA: hypothetical protein VHS96_16935, partial [Bacteroidia bacterium]|nr:hypothetical protein [Bacteroidia bacterium]
MLRPWLMLLLLNAFCSLSGQYSPPGSPQFSYQWHGNGPGCEYVFIGAYRVATPFYLKATNFLLDANGETVWY